jgi:hypothetical protein
MNFAKFRERVYTDHGIYYKLQHMTTLISREKLVRMPARLYQCSASHLSRVYTAYTVLYY